MLRRARLTIVAVAAIAATTLTVPASAAVVVAL